VVVDILACYGLLCLLIGLLFALLFLIIASCFLCMIEDGQSHYRTDTYVYRRLIFHHYPRGGDYKHPLSFDLSPCFFDDAKRGKIKMTMHVLINLKEQLTF